MELRKIESNKILTDERQLLLEKLLVSDAFLEWNDFLF